MNDIKNLKRPAKENPVCMENWESHTVPKKEKNPDKKEHPYLYAFLHPNPK